MTCHVTSAIVEPEPVVSRGQFTDRMGNRAEACRENGDEPNPAPTDRQPRHPP